MNNSKLNIEYICPICSGDVCRVKSSYPGGGNERLLNIERIVECSSCGIAFAWPMPSQHTLDEYYSGGAYWNDQVIPSNAAHIHNFSQGIARANTCKQWIPSLPNNLLDIGAGYGWQADGLISVFNVDDYVYNYWFLEPDESASNEIMQRVKVFQPNKIEDLNVNTEFDLVFMNQVLEHVSDPKNFLMLVKKRMKQGAHLYIEVPNRDDSFKNDVFPHTWFFSKQSLSYLLKNVGFELVIIEEFGCIPKKNIFTLFLRLAFRIASRLNLSSVAVKLDSLMWGYKHSDSNAIWLRALVKS